MKYKVGDFLINLDRPQKGLTDYCQIKEDSSIGAYLVKYNGLRGLRLLCENRMDSHYKKVNFLDFEH